MNDNATLDRREFSRLLATTAIASSLGIWSSAASAQIKGLELTAPSSPGSGYDQLARTVQSVLTDEKLAIETQVQNVPGGGGTVALAQFINGRKRGTSVLVVGFALVGGILTTKSPVNLTGLVPVARLMGEANVLVVPANSPIRTVADLVAKLKADPAAVTWAGGSIGGIDHIMVAMIAKASGVDPKKANFLVHAGGGEVMASTLGGHATVGVSGADEFRGQILAGRLRALAVSSDRRIEGMDAPTLREAGVDISIMNWRGLMAHPDLPEADRKLLSDTVGMMVKSAGWKTALERRGWTDTYLAGASFGAFLAAENDRVQSVLKDVGLLG